MANAIPRWGAVGGGWLAPSSVGMGEALSGTWSRRARMAGTVISTAGAEWSLPSYTCSLPRLVRMITLATRPVARMWGSSSSLSTGSISVNASRSTVSSAALNSPRSALSLDALALRPSGPRWNVVIWYKLVLQHKDRIVAVSEEKIARGQVAVVELAVDVGELDRVGRDLVPADGRDDDHGRVAAPLLGALRRELVVAAYRRHAPPVRLVQVSLHARGERAGRLTAGRPVAVLLCVRLERAGVDAKVVHHGARARVERVPHERRHRRGRKYPDDQDDDRKLDKAEPVLAAPLTPGV